MANAVLYCTESQSETMLVSYREEGLQREVRDLEQRCQAAEARHQDLAANIPEATRPLLRQLEAMQVLARASGNHLWQSPTLPSVSA